MSKLTKPFPSRTFLLDIILNEKDSVRIDINKKFFAIYNYNNKITLKELTTPPPPPPELSL